MGRLDSPALVEDAKRLARRMPQQLGVIEEAGDRGSELTVEEEVLLGSPGADEDRVRWLVRRVASAADDLERQLWSHDRKFEDVREQLEREGRVSHVERAH